MNSTILTIIPTNQFKKDLKKLKASGKYDLKELQQVIELLANKVPLPAKYRDHSLTGDKKHFRECHIRPDWLLMYEIKDNIMVLSFTRTGNHANLLNV